MKELTQLEWNVKNSFGRLFELWCPHSENLNYNSFGVYIIWQYHQSKPKTIYAGQGYIKRRFSNHKHDKRITKHHSLKNPLYVTWAVTRAKAPKKYVDGIEHYLHKKLRPLEVINSPQADPIPVNLPFNDMYTYHIQSEGNMPGLKNLLYDWNVSRRRLRIPSAKGKIDRIIP